jgi:hypothetical protein
LSLGAFLAVVAVIGLITWSVQRSAKRRVDEEFDRRLDTQQKLAHHAMVTFRQQYPGADLYDTWEHGTLTLVRLGVELRLAQSLAEDAMRGALGYDSSEFVDYMHEFRSRLQARTARGVGASGQPFAGHARICHICGQTNDARAGTCVACGSILSARR